MIKYSLYTISLSFFLTACQIGYSQINYKTYKLADIGKVQVSNLMEEQSATYKKLMNDYYEIRDIPSNNRFVFQQAGVNILDKVALETYSRFIFSITSSDKDDFNIYIKNLDQFNEELRDETESTLNKQGARLISWKKVTTKTVNNKLAITISYTRQFPKKPTTEVHIYFMESNNIVYKFNLEYYYTDKDKWYPILDNAFKSFKFFK